jgi:hypothetical protein
MSDDAVAWRDERTTRIARDARGVVERYATDPRQRALLENGLRELRAARPSPGWLTPVHLPLLVHGALAGDDEPAVPLTVAVSLLQLGIDLLDHIADGEVDACWSGQPLAVVQLASVGFLCAVPQVALAEVPAPPAIRARLHRELATGLFEVGAGQQRELAPGGDGPPSVADVRAGVAGKTGACRALFARLAAVLAGASVPETEGYARLAFHLGNALQWRSDLDDLLSDNSRDLAAGTTTLPLALWLSSLRGEERARAWELLRRAREEAGARRQVRQAWIDSDRLRWCLLLIDGELSCARSVLAELSTPPLWQGRFDAWLAAAARASSEDG